MNNKEQSERQASPVMKQLARPLTMEELLGVAGATGGCAPGADCVRPHPDDELQ